MGSDRLITNELADLIIGISGKNIYLDSFQSKHHGFVEEHALPEKNEDKSSSNTLLLLKM